MASRYQSYAWVGKFALSKLCPGQAVQARQSSLEDASNLSRARPPRDCPQDQRRRSPREKVALGESAHADAPDSAGSRDQFEILGIRHMFAHMNSWDKSPGDSLTTEHPLRYAGLTGALRVWQKTTRARTCQSAKMPTSGASRHAPLLHRAP